MNGSVYSWLVFDEEKWRFGSWEIVLLALFGGFFPQQAEKGK